MSLSEEMSAGSSSSQAKAEEPTRQGVPQRADEDVKLILFFDGTGNAFTGSSADTNVVKLLRLLDRKTSNQYHYYQTGIGTYGQGEDSMNLSLLGELRSKLSQVQDMAVGTTFDMHVLAGYRFLMRYYQTGAKIYLFGFSRGAFTARFLARLLSTVGLLCKGNEEMVPFAYDLYQRYLQGQVKDIRTERGWNKKIFRIPQWTKKSKGSSSSNGNATDSKDAKDLNAPALTQDDLQDIERRMGEHGGPEHSQETLGRLNEIQAFSDTFCRKGPDDKNIKVFFLGLWDCVGSVSLLDCSSPIPVPCKGTAHHVRHAVAVDERRVKFKPALFAQDFLKKTTSILASPAQAQGPLMTNGGSESLTHKVINGIKKPLETGVKGVEQGVHIVETTITKGLQPNGDQSVYAHDPTEEEEDIEEVWFPGCHCDVGGGWSPEKEGRMQLSDIPLAWMIKELKLLEEKDKSAALQWSPNVDAFLKKVQKHSERAAQTLIHDSLALNKGTGFGTVLMWHVMEWFPLIRRFELHISGKWQILNFPLNLGGARCIPRTAIMHQSLKDRLEKDATYRPSNHHGDRKHCLNVVDGAVQRFTRQGGEANHTTYRFDYDESLRVCGDFMAYNSWVAWFYRVVVRGMVASSSLIACGLAYYYITRYTNIRLLVLDNGGTLLKR